MVKWTSIAVVLATLTALSCHSSKLIEQPPQAVQVLRIDAAPDTGAGGLRFSAMVMPDSQVPVAFRIPGYVVALRQVRGADGGARDLAEGDSVAQGAVLARIRPAEYQDKVKQASSQAAAAEAAAHKAKLDYERAARLYESQSITKPEFDAARAQRDATQAQLQAANAVTSEAQLALRDTSITAPFSGEIVKKTVELGAFVGPGTPVFVLANTSTVKIVFGVPDTSVRSLRLGQPVQVLIDAFSGRVFNARITRMASAADPKTRNFEIEVSLANRDRRLKAGMIGSLQIEGGEARPAPTALLVPLAAIVQVPGGKYGVFLVNRTSGGTFVQLHTVELGAVEGSDIHVTSGIAPGDTVVTMGAMLLKDGQRVEVLK
jgi:multidrug efflux system membrane fusion protein